MTDDVLRAGNDWSLRPWLLAGLLGLAGLIVHFTSDWDYGKVEPWRAALTGFFFFGPLALALTWDRDSWKAPLVFASVLGAVMAGIAWRVASAENNYVDAEYWLAAAVVSAVLAIPLFQAGFHNRRWRTSYEDTHFHVWSDAICAAGALAFVGLSWLIITLLSELFRVIGIDVLRDLMREGWFGWLFSGVTFGASLGVLRNQLKIIGTLQSVVMLVLSLVAVPFAFALVIFIFAVLPSGLEVLWSATRSPTPLLLFCAAASFVLVNAIVRNNDSEASDSRVLRWSALVLALAILPLALMATVSTGTRIGEYGLSPERLWSLVAIIVAVAYGVAYFVAPIRGRLAHWMERVRGANMHLAVGTCVLALFLALPILDFGAMSAKNQIARLDAGVVEVDEFDFQALRWDFGDAGRKALEQLSGSEDEQIATLAAQAASETGRRRWDREPAPERQNRLQNVRFGFEDPALRKAVTEHVRQRRWRCDDPCVVLDIGPGEGEDLRMFAFVEGGQVIRETVNLNEPLDDEVYLAIEAAAEDPIETEQTENSVVEIREWTGRRIYIDGEPVGEPFE